jgi:toxin CcdB
MAQFDVFRLRDGTLVVDCQADLLSHLPTRFVVPLIANVDGPIGPPSLHPRFAIDGVMHVFAPQFVASIPARELTSPTASLGSEGLRVTAAIDVLMAGV